MGQSLEDMLAEIGRRNLLRKQSGLPMLETDAEIERLLEVQQKAEFEEYFEKHRHRFEHLWSPSNGRGFLSNMGIRTTARRLLHAEMTLGRLTKNK